jgi:hypothetical protein
LTGSIIRYKLTTVRRPPRAIRTGLNAVREEPGAVRDELSG